MKISSKNISDKKLQELIKWTPHEGGQDEVLKSKARFRVLACGRRWGKTEVASYMAIKKLLIPNSIVWVVAPSYELTKRVYDRVVTFLAEIFPPSEGEFAARIRPTPNIGTNWGSKLECKSADNPVSLLGGEVDLIIIDEAAIVDNNIYYQYIRPVTHDRDADIFLISTPRGKNWFFDEWIKAKDAGGAFTFKSWDRPTFSQEEMKRIKEEFPPQIIKQEYEAQFTDAASSVFSIGHITNCMVDFDHKINPEYNYTIGIDLAMSYDYFAAAVYCHETKSIVHVEKKTTDWAGQKQRIKTLHFTYNVGKVIVDTTGVGSPIYEELYHDGILVEDFHFTNITKRRMIDKLKSRIEQETITLPKNDDLYDELSSFQVNISEAGNAIYSAPRGGKDDLVDSVGLAIWDSDPNSPLLQQDRKRRGRNKRRKNKKAGSFV